MDQMGKWVRNLASPRDGLVQVVEGGASLRVKVNM